MSNKLIGKFNFIFNAMCVFGQFWQTDNPTWNEKEVADFYRPIANLGVTHLRICYQCFGRDLGPAKYKTMILPWIVENGKVNLKRKNQAYFDLARKLFACFNSIGLKIYFNPLNSCESNKPGRWKWSPWNPLNNIQGIDNIDDPKAAPYIALYIDWCIQELGEYIDVWQPINEAKKFHLPVIELIAKKLKAAGVTADRIAYSICLNLDDGDQHHWELMMYRDKIFGEVVIDAMDRCNHGIAEDPQGRFYDVLNGVHQWVFVPSTDGGGREDLSPAQAAKMLQDGLEHFGKGGIQLGPDRLNRLRLGFEIMIFPDTAKVLKTLDVCAITLEKFFGEKLVNRGKFPELPEPIPEPEPTPEPEVPEPWPIPEPGPISEPEAPPVKPPFNWQGWLNNRIDWLERKWGLVALLVLLILIFVLIF